MEVHAMAMVLAVLLTRWVAGEEEEEEEERGSRQQRMRTCSWTLWRCNRAPRGWRLLQLVSPWLTALLICMPCLGVAGHGVFTMDGGTLQSSLQFLADGLLVRDQEARPVTCHVVTSEHQNLVAEPSESFDEENPRELLQNSELGMLPELLAEDDLVPASCMLRGGSYLQQALLSTTPQAEVSVEVTIETSSSQEQGVAASLDWGSNSLTSISLKFLTLVNKQISRELKVSRIFTTNTEFCTVDFQEAVVSPGSRLSIPVAYFVNLIGKAEGRMLLQTNAGWYIVETLGEGIPFLYPLLGFMSASKSELWGTVLLLNSIDESVSVDEAYVWVESTNEVSSPHQTKGDGGVLCRRHDSEPESSNPGRLKVNPKADWFLAPHSSSPIMDLSIMVDDGKQVVGNLFFRIFRHSLHLFEVLVVPLEMEWDSLGTGHDKILAKKNLVEVAAVFLETEKGTGWARFMMNPNLLPVQVKNASTKGQSHNGCITISVENLLLGVRVKSMVAVINSTTHLSVRDLCNALLFCGASRVSKVDEHRCSETIFECPGHIFCHKCFDMPSAPCNVDAMTDGVLNRKYVNEPKLIHAQDLDGMHISLEYYIDLLALVAQSTLRSNGSAFRVNFENLRNIFTLLVSVDLGEIHGNDINILKKLTSEAFAKLSPFFHNSKSVCAWPRTVIECNTFAWIPSSVSAILRTWSGSYSRFCMGAPEHRQYRFSRDLDSGVLYTAHESNLEQSHKFSCIATYGMGLMDFEICGSECSKVFFCFKKVFVDLLEDFLQESVVEDCFGACCAPKKSILAVLFPPVCHQSLPFSRYQKLLLKLSVLIVFSICVMLIKALRRERQFAPDYRLQHLYSHTFFFQSICLKTGCIKASESSSDFEHAVGGAISLECRNGQCYENRFLVVVARVFGSLGSLFRSFFDLQATVLNVRVHISESLRTVIAEQDPNCSTNGLIADRNNFVMGPNSVEKPGNHQISTTMQEMQGNCCIESTDVLRVAHLEAGTLPSVSIPTTISTVEDVSSIRLVRDLEKVRHKDKKEKGKRRRRRSNIIDLKQESERTGRSGSSSPPSSPASPATPLSNSPISPFRQPNSPVRSLKGSTHLSGHSNTSFRDPIPRSTLIQYSSEMLSQLDVRADHDHACNPSIKGRLHHLYPLVTKESLEPLPSRMATAVKTDFCHKGSVRTDTRKDASVSGNWAAVARRAIVTSSDEDQSQNLSRSSSCFINGGTRNKPVLLPSATFPQSGRSMHWNPQKLEGRSFTLNNPTSSPSLISTSLVAPDARAPGSRPHYNEKLPVNNLLEAAGNQSEVGSTVMSPHLRMHEGAKRDTSLYDIWGDHFAEINCRTQADLFSPGSIREHDMKEITSPAFPNVGSLFAASESRTPALTQGRADATVGHSIFIPPEGFSVFSYDAFFSPYQCKDAAGSPTP